jgi:hypothetical protein
MFKFKVEFLLYTRLQGFAFFTHFLKFNDIQVIFTKGKKKVIFLDKYIQNI